MLAKMWKSWNPYKCWWNFKMMHSLWKDFDSSSKCLRLTWSHHMTQQFHSYVHTHEQRKHIFTKTWVLVTPTELLVITKRWGQLKYPLNDVMNEQNVVYNKLLFSTKKEWCPAVCYHKNKHGKSLSMKLVTKDYIWFYLYE